MSEEQAKELLVAIADQWEEPLCEAEITGIFMKIQRMVLDRDLLDLFKSKQVRFRLDPLTNDLTCWPR